MADPTNQNDPDDDLLFPDGEHGPGPRGELRPNGSWAARIERDLAELAPELPGEPTQRVVVQPGVAHAHRIKERARRMYTAMAEAASRATKKTGDWLVDQFTDDMKMTNRTLNSPLLTPDHLPPTPDLDRLVGATSLRGRQKIEEKDQSKIRVHNEDSIYFNPAVQVYAVADGLGGIGHNGGQYASREAVRAAERIAKRIEHTTRDFFETEKGRQTLQQVIEQEVRAANREIYSLRNDDAHPERKGMNSTLSLAVIAGGHLFTTNVGDSRIYEVTFSDKYKVAEPADGLYSRLGMIPRQISRDDSFIQEIQDMEDEQFAELVMKLERNGREYNGVHVDEIRRIRHGFMSNLDQQMNPHSNKMTRALGVPDDQFTVKCGVKPLEGDLLLMSDGAAFLTPADLIEALGNVEWKYQKGSSTVEMRYTFSPQRVADLIAHSANEPFSEDHDSVGYGAFAEFKRIKRKDYIAGHNMMNLPAIEKELDKPFAAITTEELEAWARRSNPASLLTEREMKDHENEWMKEFNQRFAGKDDVSVIYVRARPAVPTDIRQKLRWFGNKGLKPAYGSELTNGFSRTEIRMRNAEEDAGYMRGLFARLRTDPGLYKALDEEIAQLRKEYGEFRTEVEETTARTATETAAYRREKEGRLYAIGEVLGEFTHTRGTFTKVEETIRRDFKPDDALFDLFMKILAERQQGIDALKFFDEFSREVYAPARDAGRLYRTKARIAEGALADAVKIVKGLSDRSVKQADQIHTLEQRMEYETRELRGFQNALFVALTTNMTPEEIREMAQTYKTTGRKEWAMALEATATFVNAYLERVDAAQTSEAERYAAERVCEDLEARAREEKEGVVEEREEARNRAKGLDGRLQAYIETYGAIIGALKMVSRYLATPPEEGVTADFPSEILREKAKAFEGADKDQNLYKLLTAMAEVMEKVGEIKKGRTQARKTDETQERYKLLEWVVGEGYITQQEIARHAKHQLKTGQGDIETALSCYQLLSWAEPTNPWAPLGVAKTYIKMEKYQFVLEQCDIAEQRSKEACNEKALKEIKRVRQMYQEQTQRVQQLIQQQPQGE